MIQILANHEKAIYFEMKTQQLLIFVVSVLEENALQIKTDLNSYLYLQHHLKYHHFNVLWLMNILVIYSNQTT